MDFSADKLEKMQRRVGRMFRREVPDTPELRRILSLPRRTWQTEVLDGVANVQELADLLSQGLCRPEFRGKVSLWTHQAKALQELHDIGGLFGDAPVGSGKTLLSFLAPVVVGSERPLLIIPAKLKGKTEREFRDLLSMWFGHDNYAILTYQKLSRENGMAELERINPDFIVLDEAHKVKNPRAACTQKLACWMKEKPTTRMLAMSGTTIDRSILDCAHILEWCLPLILYPLPLAPLELQAWADAVDLIKNGSNRKEASWGALKLFCNSEELKLGRKGVRQAIRRRFQDTPGILSVPAPDVRASLNISLQIVDGYGSEVHRLAKGLLNDVMPNGQPITENDLSARWRMYRTLTSDFWYDWQPPPPEGWKERRSAWKKFVRQTLDYGHSHEIRGFESEGLITRAVQRGDTRVPDMQRGARLLADWLAVRDDYDDLKNRVPVWVDDRMLRWVAKWTKQNKGIVWVSEVALGHRLEKELGLPYYHNLGLDRRKRSIEDAHPKDGCIVASVDSNNEGRNLQFRWSTNLVISPMPNGNAWEQLLGREHRPGQEADEVEFDVLFGCRVEWECWRSAIEDSKFSTDINNRKKLTIATIDRTFHPGEVRPNALWPLAA